MSRLHISNQHYQEYNSRYEHHNNLMFFVPELFLGNIHTHVVWMYFWYYIHEHQQVWKKIIEYLISQLAITRHDSAKYIQCGNQYVQSG